MKSPREITPKCPSCHNPMTLEAAVTVRWNGKPYVVRRRWCSCKRVTTTIQAAKNFKGRIQKLPDITRDRRKASLELANRLLLLARDQSVAGAAKTSAPGPASYGRPLGIVAPGANGEVGTPREESEREHAERN